MDRRRRPSQSHVAARDAASRSRRPIRSWKRSARGSKFASWPSTPTARERDVTREAFVESGNTDVVKTVPEQPGLLEALRRGEAAVLVRYEGNYAATTLTVMGDRSGFAWEDLPANNRIDELVAAKLQAHEDAALAAGGRLRIRPPRVPRPHRPAADAGADSSVRRRCARHAHQARRARRPARRQRRLHRVLDEQVGRPVDGQPQVPGRGRGDRRCGTGFAASWPPTRRTTSSSARSSRPPARRRTIRPARISKRSARRKR